MNLLKETLNALKAYNKTEEDVRWVGSDEYLTSWSKFKEIADTDYHAGFGSAKVAEDLIIAGDNWWLERSEYDGSEGWEFRTMPIKPTKEIDLKALTVDQAEELGFDIGCGWENLDAINGIV